MAQVEVEGARALRKSLKDIEDGLADLKAAHQAAAGTVATAAAAKTSSVFRAPTGALAGSIRPSGVKGSATVRAGSARVPYAGVQEWGWPRRNIPPSPYLVPAAHETEPEWLPRYQEAIEALIAKVKGA